MSTTIALNNEVTEKVLDGIPKGMKESVMIRAASINEHTGRCLFDFEGISAGKTAVAVVCRSGKPTKKAYVIPGTICPSKLFVRPGSDHSKWDIYYVDDGEKLSERIVKIIDYQPNKALLKKL